MVKTPNYDLDVDSTLGGSNASDYIIPSQKAIKDYVDNHSSSVSADGITINTNSSDELQAIGLINKNTASGATNPKCDWVGTLQEYNDQAVATNHPEWICYITDDISGGTSVYTMAETNNLLNGKQDTLTAGTNITISGNTISASGASMTDIVNSLFPVGSCYITTASTCPLASIAGTWTQETSRVLVEKKEADNNDARWYNLYSDGYCEQGVTTGSLSDGGTYAWTFSKVFKNTDYSIQLSLVNAGNYATVKASTAKAVGSITLKQFSINGSSSGIVCATACGYTSTTTGHKRFRRTA